MTFDAEGVRRWHDDVCRMDQPSVDHLPGAMARLAAALDRITELEAECERHRKARLVRAVVDGWGDRDEWITEVIAKADWEAVPWMVAEKLRAENARLRAICQRIRAGWLPHRLRSGSWWWGRPHDDGFNLWATGVVPSMEVVERMTPEDIETWTATLHVSAPEAPA